MKRFLSILGSILLIFVSCHDTKSQTGPWSGKLEVYGSSLTLVFHLDADSCRMDSPDQGAYDIPATLERNSMQISISVPSINATYKGVFLGKSIVGTYIQHGQSFPLTLTAGVPRLNRPQTPEGPFPYSTEEVSFTNGSAVLRGTLTIPPSGNAAADTPVLIMVTGSGLQNRDEEIFEHKPFAVIADALARHGIASLRYDDRGFGESTGDIINVTTEDFKNDALAGIRLLRERFTRVGILGHSEGGTIALMLAAEGEVDFAISLAGMTTSGKETLLWQNRLSLSEMGYPDSVTGSYIDALTAIFESRTPDMESLPAELRQNLQAVAAQATTPYLRQFVSLDISGSIPDIVCPVLALNGTKDMQVEYTRNLGIIRDALLGEDAVSVGTYDWSSEDGRTTIKAMEGLNHLFQHCTTGSTSEYKDIEQTISPEVLDIITAWLLSNLTD